MTTQLKLVILDSSLRQYEVAQRARVTETRLSRLATGRAAATKDERRRIAEALATSEESLFPPAA